MAAIRTETSHSQELWRRAELRWSEDLELDLGPKVRAELIAGILLIVAMVVILLAIG